MRVGKRAAAAVNYTIMLGGTAAGLLFEQPALWYETLALTSVCILGPILLGGWLVQKVADRWGARIQGPRKAAPPIKREILETVRSMYVVALMAAWPIAYMRVGADTGLVWTVEEMARCSAKLGRAGTSGGK